MARRRGGGRGGGGAEKASSSKEKKKSKMSKEQRQKLVKSLTAQLEAIIVQVRKFGKVPDDLDFTNIAAQYSGFLYNPGDGRDEKLDKKDKKDKTAVKDDFMPPAWNYGSLTGNEGLQDVPALTSLSQLRQHLRDKAHEALAAQNSSETANQRIQLLAHMIELEKDDRDKRKAKGDVSDISSASAAPLSPAVSLGINAIFAFLAEASQTHPELCVKPLQLLAEVIAAYQPQQLANESDAPLLEGVFGMLEVFAKVDRTTSQPSGSSLLSAHTLADVLHQAQGTGLAALVALSLAKGGLSDVLTAIRILLAHVSTTGAVDEKTSVSLPVPKNLQVLTKMARGVTSNALVVPTEQTLANAFALDSAVLGDKLLGAVPVTPSSLICDGSYLYAYLTSSTSIVKFGTGYNDTSAGQVVATLLLSNIFEDTSAPSAASADTSVQLAHLPGNKILVIATPDPVSGYGSGLRIIDSAFVERPGIVNTPYHGGVLIEEMPSRPNAGPIEDVLSLATLTAPGATLPAQAMKIFGSTDGAIFILSRAEDADDRSFGRIGPERYSQSLAMEAADAAIAADSSARAAAAEVKTSSTPEPAPVAFGVPAAGFGLFGAPPPAAVEPKPESKKKKDASLPTIVRKKVLHNGITYDPSRPAGSTKCVLRKFILSAADLPAEGASPAARLKLEASSTVFIPAASTDCQVGVATKPEWDANKVVEFPSWCPPILSGDQPVLPKSFVSNNSTHVLIATDGRVFYCGDGQVLGCAAAASWTRYDGLGDAKVSKVALAPRCKHALFLAETGEVFAVGAAEDGQLGLDLKSDKQKEILVPRRVLGELSDKVVVDIAVAEGKSAAVTSGGSLYSWGTDSGHGELGWSGAKKSLRRGGVRKKTPTLVAFADVAPKAAAASAGDKSAGGAGFKGAVFAGQSLDEVAREYIRGKRDEPAPLGDEPKFAFTLPDLGVAQEEARAEFWFDQNPESVAQITEEPTDATTIVSLSEAAPLVAESGAAEMPTPTEITPAHPVIAGMGVDPADTFIVAVALSSSHMVAVSRGGGCWTVGDNALGQCGRSAKASKEGDEEKDVALGFVNDLPARVVHASLGEQFSLVLCADGSVWSFGDNSSGCCGVESTAENLAAPTKVMFPDPAVVTQISTVGLHAVAVTDAGDAYAWGRNKEGQLGGCNGVTKDDAIVRLPALQTTLKTDMGPGMKFASAFCVGTNTVYLKAPVPLSEEQLRNSQIFATPDSFALICPSLLPGDAYKYEAVMVKSSTAQFLGRKPVDYNGLRDAPLSSGNAGSGIDLLARGEDADFEKPAAFLDTRNNTLLPAACVDSGNGLVWACAALVSPDCGSTLCIARYETAPAESNSSSQSDKFTLSGKQVLADPRFAVPVAASGQVSVVKAAMSLLGVLDVFTDRSANPPPQASDDAVIAVSKVKPSTAGIFRAPLEEINRFKSTNFIQGWGMGGMDCVSFKVSEDVYLFGYGVFGTTDNYRGKIILHAGFDTSGEKLAEKSFDLERKAAADITEILFDDPILLSAGEQYHMAQEHVSPHGSGWYCNGGGGGGFGADFKVESDVGVEFVFCQTRDGRNNGSSCDRGQMPKLFFKTTAAVARSSVKADPTDGSVESTESFPVIDYNKFTAGLSAAGLTSLLGILEWALGALERAPRSSDTHVVASFCLRVVLRAMRNILQKSIPDTIELVPGSAMVEKGYEAMKELDAAEDPGVTAATKVLRATTGQVAAVSWLPADIQGQATTLWEVDHALRRIFSLDVQDSVLEDARSAYIAAFPLLYPTWKLRLLRLNSVLDAMTENCSRRDGMSLLFEVVLHSLSLEKNLSAVLGSVEPQVVAFLREQNGATESKSEEQQVRTSPRGLVRMLGQASSGAKDTKLPLPDGPLSKDALSLEPLLLELYSAERVTELNADNNVQGAQPLLALLRSYTDSRLRATAAVTYAATDGPPPSFVKSASSLLAALQDQFVEAIGQQVPCNLESQEEAVPATNKLSGPPMVAQRFDSACPVGWGYGGSPDAICFRVDTPVLIAGVGLYGGSGGEYTAVVKLYEGSGPGGAGAFDEEGNPIVGGGDELSSVDAKWEAGDSTPQEIIFDEPILIEADKQYCAYATVTSHLSSCSGTGGKTEVEGPDGVKFTFEYSSASSNGTGTDGGQFPQILYHAVPKALPKVTKTPGKPKMSKQVAAPPLTEKSLTLASLFGSSSNGELPAETEAKDGEPTADDGAAARALAAVVAFRGQKIEQFLRLISLFLDYANSVLAQASALHGSEVTSRQIREMRAALDQDAVLSQILPRSMPHVSRIIASDPEHAAFLTGRLAALLLTLDELNDPFRKNQVDESLASLKSVAKKPTLARKVSDDVGNFVMDLSSPETQAAEALASIDDQESGYHRTVVESDHPYTTAERKQWDIKMSEDCNWMLLLFDPLSSTTQIEDRVILYADTHCKQRVCLPFYGQPLDAGDEIAEGEADRKKRAALLNKNWPRQALLVPGNSLTVVFDTASDYVNNANASKFGFRLVITGHSLSLPSSFPLIALEREVAHATSLAVASSIAAEASRSSPSLKAVVPVKRSGSGPTVVRAWEWEQIAGSNCAIEGGTVTASSSMGSSGVLLSHGASSGHLYWDMNVEEETTSQCTCLGIATREINTLAYQNPEAWMYRCFNGAAYKLAGEERAGGAGGGFDGKINKGDTVAFHLDMDAGVLYMAIRDGEEKAIFEGIHDKVGVGGEVAPCILFYSTGPGRRVALSEVRSSGVKGPGAKDLAVFNDVAGSDASTVLESAQWLTKALQSKLFSAGLLPSTRNSSAFFEDALANSSETSTSVIASGPGSRMLLWLERLDEGVRTATKALIASRPSTACSGEDPLLLLLSEEQRRCVRAAFCAYLWHHGLSADAMATASFLRFNPSLGSAAFETVPSVLAEGADESVTVIKLLNTAQLAVKTYLPPVLKLFVDIFCNLSSAIRGPLFRTPIPQTASAGSQSAEVPSGPESHASFDALRKKVQEVSFRVRGGAEDAKSPAPGTTVPKHIQKELDVLGKARAGLPLHITADMGWEAKKARHITMPEGDNFMAGPAKAPPPPAGFGFGAVPAAAEEVCIVFAKAFDPERYAVHYFEIEILEKGKDNVVCIGLIPEHDTSYRGHLGWRNKTMGYHGDDGVIHCSGLPASETFTEGDTIGVGWVSALDYVFFTKNGKDLGIKYTPPFFSDPPARSVTDEGVWKLRPAVSCREGAVFIANFGQAPFSFLEMEALRQLAIEASIKRADKPQAKAIAKAPAASSVSGISLSELDAKSAQSSDVFARARMLLELNPCIASNADVKAFADAPAPADTSAANKQFSPPLEDAAAQVSSAPLPAMARRLPPASAPTLSRAVSLDSSRPHVTKPSLNRNASAVDDHDEGSSMIAHPSPALLAAAKGIITSDGAEPAKFAELAADIVTFLVGGARCLNANKEDVFYEDDSTVLGAQSEVSTMLRVLRARCDRALKREQALQTATTLLSSITSPLAVQELLWSLATSLHAQSTDFIPDEDQAGDMKELEANRAEKWLLSNNHPVGQSPFFSDLNGCGSTLMTRVRNALHKLLETAAEHLVDPAALKGTANRIVQNARKSKSAFVFSSSRKMIQLLALRVWRLPLDEQDHAFLQNSTIFARLRDLMQADECGRANKSAARASIQTVLDITSGIAVEASSNKDRAVTLTDSTTETYWEPDGPGSTRDFIVTVKPDSIKEACLKMKERRAGKPDEDVYVYHETQTYSVGDLAVFLDFGRDKERKVKTVTCTFGAHEDICTLPESFVGWLYLRFAEEFLPVTDSQMSIVVKFSGSNMPRVRGLRVFAHVDSAVSPIGDGLRVDSAALASFRALASQVFSGLSTSEPAAPVDDVPPAPAAGPALDRQGSELRQRVAGMLFDNEATSKGQLGGLQSHLLDLIAAELDLQRHKFLISKWWCNQGASAAPAVDGAADPSMAGDTYCFELVSMLQSLSSSPEGRMHVAAPGLLSTCVQLFPVATPRIQRSLLQIFKRVLARLRPELLDAHLKVPHALLKDVLQQRLRTAEAGLPDGAKVVSEGDTKPESGPGSFVAYLLLILGKSLSIQTKGRAAGRPVTSNSGLSDDIFAGVVPASVAATLASLFRSLLEKTPEELLDGERKMIPVAEAWQAAFRAVSAALFSVLPLQMETVMDAPAKCAYLPQVWASLALLLVVGEKHDAFIKLATVAPAQVTEGAAGVEDHYCDNHQDGKTLADVACDSCANDYGTAPDAISAHLCRQCDAVIHLRKSVRDHTRRAITSRARAAAENLASVDYVQGCARFKLQWLQVAVYEQRCKATIEFKKENHPSAMLASSAAVADRCRFCQTDLTVETRSRVPPASAALENVCNSADCEDKAKLSCTKVKDCGHFCGGVCGEDNCLPCFQGCDGIALEADTLCDACMTENVGEAPSIRLDCGHVFHHDCISRKLKLRWHGPRIEFGFMGCPLCRRRISHASLAAVLEPLLKLEEIVKKKAMMRLSYENLDKAPEVSNPESQFYRDPMGYAMHRFAYYLCCKCNLPYYGGEARCGAAADVRFNPEELICTNCMPHSADAECPKHGRDFITYKCQFCCSEALFFCFGTTHFCDRCHSNPGMMQDMKTGGRLPHCPAGPLGKQCSGTKADCELKSKHPEPGEEFVLGCSICRNASTF